MLYNSNFDDRIIPRYNNREFNKTIDDPCAIQQKNSDNNKKLKFITTNHRDLLDGKTANNFFGMTTKDQLFVPSEKIDAFSNLRNGQNGNMLTNCNIKTQFTQLPFPTMPSRYQLYHGDVVIEDSMRNHINVNKKSCNAKSCNYYLRHFYIFDDSNGIETPNALKSTQTKEWGPRGGISTRYN